MVAMEKDMGSQTQCPGQKQSAIGGLAKRHHVSPALLHSAGTPQPLASQWPPHPHPVLLPTSNNSHLLPWEGSPATPQIPGRGGFPFPGDQQAQGCNRGKWGSEQSSAPCHAFHRCLLTHLPRPPSDTGLNVLMRPVRC